MFELEKYKGTVSRHTCPACNSKRSFTRYVNENGEYLGECVGRCNRESKCGYHLTPKQFFTNNPKTNSTKPGIFVPNLNKDVTNGIRNFNNIKSKAKNEKQAFIKPNFM